MSLTREPIPHPNVFRQLARKRWGSRVKALAWYGKGDIRCEAVPDPKIEHPRDAIIKVTAVPSAARIFTCTMVSSRR